MLGLTVAVGGCTSAGTPSSALPEPRYVVGQSLTSPDVVLVDTQTGRTRTFAVSHWGPAQFATDPADSAVYATGAYFDATTQRLGRISFTPPGLSLSLSVGFCLGCLYRQMAVTASQSVVVASGQNQLTEVNPVAPSQDRQFSVPAGAGDVALSPDGSVLFVDNSDSVARGSTSGYVVSVLETSDGALAGTASLTGDPISDLVPLSDTELVVGTNLSEGSTLQEASTTGPDRTLVIFPSSMLCLAAAGPEHVVVLLAGGEADYVSLVTDHVVRSWNIGPKAYCPSVTHAGDEAIFPDASTLVTVDLSATRRLERLHVELPLYEIAAVWGRAG